MSKITFYGGSGEVTGSNFLLQAKNSKIIVDCGLFQGRHFYDSRNNDPFPYDTSVLDAVLITHAHIDHIGRLPKLVKGGFRGKIFATPATREFAEIMLLDSLGVLQKEAERKGKMPFYNEDDIFALNKFWEEVNYNEKFKFGDLEINFKDAGHILGSAIIEIFVNENTNSEKNSAGKKIVFTGDLGNPPTPLLRPTEKVQGANVLIIDSTYGGKIHEGRKERKLKLERAIEDAARENGALLMPAFSLERTQEILFELNDLVEKNRIPKISVFVDSPLSIKLMPIYKKHEFYYNKEAKYVINSGDDIFSFPNLHFSLTTEESKKINDAPLPKMIIAGSGMMNGGRIGHHAKKYLGDKNTILLFIGFQAASSVGRRIQEGAKKVEIYGDEVQVRAKIETIDGYSAHPDSDGIFNFVSESKETLEKVFMVHGEPKNALFLVQKVRDNLGIHAESPSYGDSFEI